MGNIDGDGNNGGWRTQVGPFLTMGMELAFAVVGMFFLGRLVDGHWGTEPWGMFVGLIVGITGGFIRFFRRVMEMSDREKGDQGGGHER